MDKNREGDLNLLYKIACYYYQDGLMQEEIAELERISRSQISRYLSRARELGIVKVSVSLPDIPGFSAMEKRLEEALGLEKVVIAPCSSNRELAIQRAIASSASIYLLEALRDAHIIGFGWGRTVYETSLQLPFSKEKQNALYVPLIGVSGINDSAFQTNTIIDRIAAMYAYDLDLTRRIAPGDSIDMLLSGSPETGDQELLYVSLKLGNTVRELFRFRTEDGVIDFYNPDGETGKQFLLRRPLEGGGTLRSRYGYRRHPVFGDYRLHTGADLAARTGTPIYAGGDGVIDRAQWFSGYGRYVEIRHANGYNTAYGHMSAIADGITPGTRVSQGQVIGYVGSTGVSTGPHLHYEIKINGHTVDPLAVKLPRANSLPPQYRTSFDNTVAQIRALMAQDAGPNVTVASN